MIADRRHGKKREKGQSKMWRQKRDKKNTARASWKDRARMSKIEKKERTRISCVNRSIIIGQKEHEISERKFQTEFR